MIITTDQLKKILAAGASLVIDGSAMANSQLVELVSELPAAPGTITIRNIQNITNEHLRQIASIAPGKIIFDLT